MNEPEIEHSTSNAPIINSNNLIDPISTNEQNFNFELSIINEHEDDFNACNFWICNYNRGILHPLDLIKRESSAQILLDAVTKGINEHGRIMVADTESKNPRYFYLVDLPNDDFRETAIWVSSISNVIQSWHLNRIGFYFQKNDQDINKIEDLLEKILRSIITDKSNPLKIQLMIRDSDANAILNMALRVKSELEMDDIKLDVYH